MTTHEIIKFLRSMTTQEIIKSLRTCAGHPGCTGCGCQAGYVNEQESCIDWLMRHAADELERLSRENERTAEDIAKFAGREAYGG